MNAKKEFLNITRLGGAGARLYAADALELLDVLKSFESGIFSVDHVAQVADAPGGVELRAWGWAMVDAEGIDLRIHKQPRPRTAPAVVIETLDAATREWRGEEQP